MTDHIKQRLAGLTLLGCWLYVVYAFCLGVLGQ